MRKCYLIQYNNELNTKNGRTQSGSPIFFYIYKLANTNDVTIYYNIPGSTIHELGTPPVQART